ncbi:putative transcription factor interactor and regulator FHA-SMAD family [Lupinus albus]|uniref:Putative transcription factor interactor and regulator FHA-SMAD family n=1 Tax=Lupinus albus TaxID=3870 RepID=A0A6A4P7M6_LUPAL|nr:putative transcription factor interactor and regulator FHA-SMAD family [Lupinus albus]
MDFVALPPWIPEDDLLLKNAVEGGASLESLAKGAVRFSRKYSFTELRDRWYSLLYDPVVSAEAAAKMVSLELAGGCGGSSLKPGGSGSKDVSGEGASYKREIESVRRHYNATKKRFRRQVFFDTFDRALQDEMNIENDFVSNEECLGRKYLEGGGKVRKHVGVEFGGTDNGVSLVECKLNKDMNHMDNLIGYENYSGLEAIGPSHSIGDVPLWKSIEDVTVPAMPVQMTVENKNHSTEERVTLPHDLKGESADEVLNASAARFGEGVKHLSDSLLNLTSEDEHILMDIDVKGATDKPCYDNVDSLLLSSPFEIQGNDATDIHEPQKDTETKGSSASELEVVANPLRFEHGDLRSTTNPGYDTQSSVAAQSPHSELSEKFVICLFNTEDPNVPSDDGTDFSVVVPFPGTLKSQPIDEEVVRPASVPENPRRSSISAVSGQNNDLNINPSQSRPVHPTMMLGLDGRPKQKEIDALDSAKVYVHQKEGDHNSLPKSEAKPLSLDPEGDDDDDNDIPYFSDVETLILEMDLSPSDQDTSANIEVLIYQLEETKRTIMRLEQCFQSFMHRAIASRGAVAVLFGRKLKEYIKKSEVVLGRATVEVKVDIDLGREGCANKISRRQALIKMEPNGSFIIKNLGKGSIFLNGKEIASGQIRLLSASSFIQIRDMSFIFESYDKCVRKFLENVDKDRSI